MTNRKTILELLPTHQRLLNRHQGRLVWMVSIAKLDPTQLGGIIARADGCFGVVAAEAGSCFLDRHPEGDAVVLAMGLWGVVDIAEAVVPEAVQHILDRPPSTLPILIVDCDDEPAVALLALEDPQVS